MAFEQIFNIAVNGKDQLDAVDRITKQIGTTTKMTAGELRTFEGILKSAASSGDNLKKTLQDLAKGGGDVSASMSKAAKDILSLGQAEAQAATSGTQAAASQQKLADAVNKVGDAHSKAVPEIAAASAAIRTFEGAIPIRAVERFLVTIGGLGPALVAAFPLIGALALTEVFVKMIEKLFDVAHGFDLVGQAEERAFERAKGFTKETDKLTEAIERQRVKYIELTQGKVAALNYQAGEKGKDANLNDQATIDNIRRQISAQEAIIAANQPKGFSKNSFSAADRVAQARGEKPPADIAAEQRAGEARVNIRSLNEALTVAQLQQRKDLGESTNFSLEAKKAAEADAERAARAARRELKSEESAAAKAEREQHERDAQVRSIAGAGEDPKTRLYDRYQTVSSSALFKENPEQLGALLAAFQQGYAREEEKDFAKRLAVYDQIADGALGGAERIIGSQGKQGSANISRLLSGPNGRSLAPLFAGGIDPNEQIRLLNDQERQGVRGINIASQLSPGNEIAAAKQVRDLEIATQAQRYTWEKSIAALKADSASALKDAEFENARKVYDINAEYEDKLLEKKKADQSAFRGAVQGGFQALISGGGGGFGSFLKSQAVGFGSTIAGNAADLIYPSIQGAVGNKLNLDPNSLIGKLAKGTPFAADPAKDLNFATKLNTDATAANTAALESLRLAAVSPSGGGGSIGGGISAGGGAAAGLGKIFDEDGNLTDYGAAATKPGGFGSSYSGLSGVLGGLAHTGDVRGIFTGVTSGAESLSTSERIGAGIGTAGTLYAGYRGVSEGIQQGGAYGTFGAISAGAATAAALDPEPISKAGLEIAAVVSKGIQFLLGDPHAERAKQIDKELGNAKFEDPISINQTRDQNGNYVDSDRFGNLRQSPFSAVPVIQESSQQYRNGAYTPIPGGVVSPYSPSVVVQVQTMDSKSFNDNAHLVVDAVSHAISSGKGDGMVNALNYAQGR